MKKILFIIFMVCSLPMHANTAKDDLAAIQALTKRIIPEQADHFIFKVTKSQKDQFRLESKGQKIQISGNNANSMAVGLNHYLKYYCKVEVGWFSHDTFTMPAKLPKVTRPVTVDARVKDRFFLNYCTFTWYSSKNEIRITGFGRGFSLLNPEKTGSLFVMTKIGSEEYSGFIFDTDDDIQGFLDCLTS